MMVYHLETDCTYKDGKPYGMDSLFFDVIGIFDSVTETVCHAKSAETFRKNEKFVENNREMRH